MLNEIHFFLNTHSTAGILLVLLNAMSAILLGDDTASVVGDSKPRVGLRPDRTAATVCKFCRIGASMVKSPLYLLRCQLLETHILLKTFLIQL